MAVASAAARTSTIRRALAIAGAVPVRLEGTSMHPLVVSGASGRLVACGPADLRRFDVAVFERHGRIVAHVVSHLTPGGPRVAALGARAEALPLTESELLGRLEGLVVRGSTLGVPRWLARVVVGGSHRLRSWRQDPN